MAKQAQIKNDEMDLEEELTPKPLVDEEENAEGGTEEDETLDPEEVDPFHDKWEE